jgi:hypothetical protein
MSKGVVKEKKHRESHVFVVWLVERGNIIINLKKRAERIQKKNPKK